MLESGGRVEVETVLPLEYPIVLFDAALAAAKRGLPEAGAGLRVAEVASPVRRALAIGAGLAAGFVLSADAAVFARKEEGAALGAAAVPVLLTSGFDVCLAFFASSFFR